MKPIDLQADQLAAAIHARPADPRLPVWVHVEIAADQGRPAVNRWCVLRAADHQRADERDPRIATLCCAELRYAPIEVTTRQPSNSCPACEIELAARTPGAALAVEPSLPSAEVEIVELLDEDAITKPRTLTRDLYPEHRRVDPPTIWDGGAPGSDSAFDSLNDLRLPEEP